MEAVKEKPIENGLRVDRIEIEMGSGSPVIESEYDGTHRVINREIDKNIGGNARDLVLW